MFAFKPLQSIWSDPPPHNNVDDEDADRDADDDDTPMETIHDDDEDAYDNDDDDDLDIEEDETVITRTTPTASQLDWKALQGLYNSTVDTFERKFIMAYKANPVDTPTPQVVEIVMSDLAHWAREMGVYPVHFYAAQEDDNKERALVNCKVHDLIHRINADNTLGPSWTISPNLAHKFLEDHELTTWPILWINLADSKLVGPFSFSKKRLPMVGPKRQAISEPFRIDESIWDQVERNAPILHLDVSTIKITPTQTMNTNEQN